MLNRRQLIQLSALLTAYAGRAGASQSETRMPSNPMIDYYRQPTKWTGLAAHSATIKGLPRALNELVAIIQGLLIYDVVAANFYGVNLTPEHQQSIHLRSASELLDAALSIDAGPLGRVRPPSKRVPSRCDHYTRLLTALLRAQGVPARARCGFADYFRPGFFEDHWVCEYWNTSETRWVMVDAQLDGIWRERLTIDFSPLDVPSQRFITAGEAWRRCRSGGADPHEFGLSFVNLRGLWYVAGNIVRDVAALNKMELLPWDVWGAQPMLNASLTPEQLSWFDRLSGLASSTEVQWVELRSCYRSDRGLLVPPQVFNAVRQRMEVI
jgi:hypothetical protein